MSRTRINRHLEVVARAIRAGRQQGIPALEMYGIQQEQRRARLRRRDVLLGLGALPLLGGCTVPILGDTSWPADTAAVDSSARVAVVGGGLAGLACCHRLAKAGVRADLYEASPSRLGGRVRTGRDLFTEASGVVTELGGEFIDSNHTELRSLIDELGLSLVDLTADESLSDVYWFGGRRVSPATVFAGLTPVIDACDAALTSVHSDEISYLNPCGAETLDQLSIPDFLATTGATTATASLLELMMTNLEGVDAADQSALNLLYALVWEGTESDERYTLSGGSDTLITALGELYADQIQLGRALEALLRNADGTYTLRFSDGTEVEADMVVLAIPFTLLREVDLQIGQSEVKQRCIDELGYGSNAKLLVPYQRPIWREQGDNGYILTNEAFQSTWDSSRMQGSDIGVLTTYVGGSAGEALCDGTASEQAASVVDAVEAIWPGSADLAGTDPTRAPWPIEPWSKGSYSCYRVGQWTGIGGAEAEAVGNVYFAGEHTSLISQGYMNGAAETGKAAAEQVLAALAGTTYRRPVRAARRRPARRA